MSITRINEFYAADGKADALYDFLNSLIPYISSSEGCLSCKVLRSQDDESKYVVLETWQSVEMHKQSIENFPKENMEAAMSLFGEPPQGSFYQG